VAPGRPKPLKLPSEDANEVSWGMFHLVRGSRRRHRRTPPLRLSRPASACFGLTAVANVGRIANMKAALLLRRRVADAAGGFAEYVVWLLPTPLPPSTHTFKYRLAYVVGRECVIRYDNEVGKGDHRHYGGKEQTYRFSSPKQLIADFESDIPRWNRENSDS
jgi:Family of unknown function (DUF6516)